MRQLREDDPEEGPYDEALSFPAMRELLADHSFGRVWLIRSGSETAGYVVLTLCYSVELGGRYAFVDELFVAGEFRGRGIGSAALRLVAAEARALGVRALSLEVTRSNATARRLYARNGFVARGHELMTRRLDAAD
jgi:ribosomal protein S18 acetylase RimI-like enzyme